MERPIFILGCTKSGTTLMRNLFDGHPDLFVIPFEAHFFQLTGRGIDYSYRRTVPFKSNIDEQKKALIGWIEFCNNRVNPIADGFSHGKLNVQQAIESLGKSQAKSERELSDAYVEAIYKAVFGISRPSTVDFVEKSVENAEMSSVWRSLYPKARFVHILRNPYSNLVAMRKYGSHNRKGTYPRLKNALQAMTNSYYWLYRNLRDIEGYQVITYDQLTQDVESTMKTLCNNIDLKWDNILTTPTSFGEAWGGNSTSGKKMSGVTAANNDSWKLEITANEADLVNRHFGHVLADFGFEPHKPTTSVWMPAPKERPEIYVYNRLMKYYM